MWVRRLWRDRRRGNHSTGLIYDAIILVALFFGRLAAGGAQTTLRV